MLCDTDAGSTCMTCRRCSMSMSIQTKATITRAVLATVNMPAFRLSIRLKTTSLCITV